MKLKKLSDRKQFSSENLELKSHSKVVNSNQHSRYIENKSFDQRLQHNVGKNISHQLPRLKNKKNCSSRFKKDFKTKSIDVVPTFQKQLQKPNSNHYLGPNCTKSLSAPADLDKSTNIHDFR